MEIQFKKAAAENAYEIAALATKLWTSHTVEELAEGFAAAINDPGCAVFLVTDGGKTVGFAQCGLRHDYVEGTSRSPVGYLEGIFIEEKKNPARNLQATASLTMRSADSSISAQAFGKQTGSSVL